VYPNPCNQYLQLHGVLTSKAMYKIFNLTGGVCANGFTQGSIDVSVLAPGVYCVVLTVNKQEIAMRFVKN
jgi:hypothetical protein